jgi:hypothetical protein
LSYAEAAAELVSQQLAAVDRAPHRPWGQLHALADLLKSQERAHAADTRGEALRGLVHRVTDLRDDEATTKFARIATSILLSPPERSVRPNGNRSVRHRRSGLGLEEPGFAVLVGA